jgi:DNA-binding NarL/FixJ family response regulator
MSRVARTLGYLHGYAVGDFAVGSGWLARAKTLLADAPNSSERGWVALTEGMFEENRAKKEAAFLLAIEVAGRTGDADLAHATRAYLGASMVHGDRVSEGMVLLDEALASVAGGEVEDFVIVEEIFCQMYSACEHAQDVRRAEQWLRVGQQIAERRRLTAVSAYCCTHYGAMLTAAGRWPEAEAALTEAVRLWSLGGTAHKASALIRLADLRVRQGRYDEAATMLEGIDTSEATLARAGLQLARGEHALALDLLEHAVQKADPASSACIPLLGLLADAELACGEDPTRTIANLSACAEAHPSAYSRAVLALAHGRAGQGDVKRWLRDAVDGFTETQLPLEAAVSRLELARVSAATSPEVAVAEARRALQAFEVLEAVRYVDAATAVLRDLGEKVAPPRPTGQVLTRREDDVLRLLGEGLSNPEIAQRLFISRKTVEHHVGNLLVKLGLRNRAEAAAYAVRREPASK